MVGTSNLGSWNGQCSHPSTNKTATRSYPLQLLRLARPPMIGIKSSLLDLVNQLMMETQQTQQPLPKKKERSILETQLVKYLYIYTHTHMHTYTYKMPPSTGCSMGLYGRVGWSMLIPYSHEISMIFPWSFRIQHGQTTNILTFSQTRGACSNPLVLNITLW